MKDSKKSIIIKWVFLMLFKLSAFSVFIKMISSFSHWEKKLIKIVAMKPQKKALFHK